MSGNSNSSRVKKTAAVQTLADEVTGTAVQLPPAPVDRVRMVTWEGHEYAVDPMAMDDVIFMEWLGDMDENPALVAKVVRRLLGDEPRKDEKGEPLPSQWQEFKENHKDEHGRIASQRIADFMDVLNKELTALGN